MVFLPPDGPTKATVFPASIDKVKFFNICFLSSYLEETLSISMLSLTFLSSIGFLYSFFVSSLIISINLSNPVIPF